MLQDIKEALKQPMQVPQINIPPIPMPIFNTPSKEKNPDFVEGFLLSAAFDLRDFPVKKARALIDNFNEQLRQARLELYGE